MVHPDVYYQELLTAEGETWILAEPLVEKVMKLAERGYTVGKKHLGKTLEKWTYTSPLAAHLDFSPKGGNRVVCSARYVTTEDGTGMVHCAPGHGKEDYEVGKANGLPLLCPVDIDGRFTDEAKKYAGKQARETNAEIIEDLNRAGFIVAQKAYDHDYPLCWRDKSPLLMVSQPQWFLKISAIQKKLLAHNKTVTWVPAWMGQRMETWIQGISDWPVSRQRYWGAPLPIWVNDLTGTRKVIGTVSELMKLTGRKTIPMHKPGIDEVAFSLKGEKGTYRRVPEVLDVWFDSGVSSWAALSPLGAKGLKRYWPADVNIEGRDQIRGWWNSQLILSEILFGKVPFKTIAVHGMVLDISKRKMSKSEGNVTSPADVIGQYGRDMMRYYFAKFSKGEDFSYDPKEMQEIGKLFGILANLNTFIGQLPSGQTKQKHTVEDAWILSRYHRLIQEVTHAYNTQQFFSATQALEQFIIQDLSRTYIQMIRERADEAGPLLREIRIGLLSLLAPITPFLCEGTWQTLREQKEVKELSLFLGSFPRIEKNYIDDKGEQIFQHVQKVVELGLRARDKAHIGLKWPLGLATITSAAPLPLAVRPLIMKQLQVKKLAFVKGTEYDVTLDTTLTPALEGEGYARELARAIQGARKEAGLQKGELIITQVHVSPALEELLAPYQSFLLERTNSKKIVFLDEKKPLPEGIVLTVRERRIVFSFRRC
jgi:isoleucyl-tRNA synthetase